VYLLDEPILERKPVGDARDHRGRTRCRQLLVRDER